MPSAALLLVESRLALAPDGRSLATTDCPGCCGPCNIYHQLAWCGQVPGFPSGDGFCFTPPGPVYACRSDIAPLTYPHTVLINGLCYIIPELRTAQPYWRFTPVDGVPPLPEGAVIVPGPLDGRPAHCLDPLCGHPERMVVLGYPCNGNPPGCGSIAWCATDVPVCGYLQWGECCYRLDPAFPLPESSLPPGTEIHSGHVDLYPDCCACLRSCLRTRLVDQPCAPAARCYPPVPTPGPLPGPTDPNAPPSSAPNQGHPCDCCCSDGDVYSLQVFNRYVVINPIPGFAPGETRSYYIIDPGEYRVSPFVDRHYRIGLIVDGQAGPEHSGSLAPYAVCGWGATAAPYDILQEIIGDQSYFNLDGCATAPHGSTPCPQPGPGCESCHNTAYGWTNNCEAFAYSARRECWRDVDGDGSPEFLHVQLTDSFRIIRVADPFGRCTGGCSGGGTNYARRPAPGVAGVSGGCAGCGKDTGL